MIGSFVGGLLGPRNLLLIGVIPGVLSFFVFLHVIASPYTSADVGADGQKIKPEGLDKITKSKEFTSMLAMNFVVGIQVRHPPMHS